MKDRPILFSGPMVRALLNDTKTQTRRVVKPQPVANQRGKFNFTTFTDDEGIESYWQNYPFWGPVRCPYGQPGDRLWVKETWRTAKSLDSKSPATIAEMCIDAGYRKPWAPLAYEADGHRNSEWRRFEMVGDAEPGKTRASIHMPRWASRITLEITAVRVERLQDISEADAIAEGVEKVRELVNPECTLWRSYGDDDTVACRTAKCSYRTLWEQINGPGSWDANPWVWVVEFKRITQ